MTNPYPPQPGDPTQYAQQPQVPPPPKKRRKWPWVVGGIVIFLIAIGALSDPKETGDKGKASETSSSASQGALGSDQHDHDETGGAPAGLNTPVRDGKFEFVVTAVQPGLAEIGDNPYLTRQAQGQFVVVAMSVKNIGDKPQSFSPGAQKLFDTDGRSFESDTMAQIALGNSDVPVYDNINPGNGVEVKVVYDMPPDAVPATIELHDSVLSGGVKVSIRG